MTTDHFAYKIKQGASVQYSVSETDGRYVTGVQTYVYLIGDVDSNQEEG